jgi:DNA repair exonuclease SbcCD ATPase subunit
MKKSFVISIVSAIWCAATLSAHANGDYASDVATVLDAETQAMEQARTELSHAENPSERFTLEAAIKEMEHSRAALEAAKKAPEKLPAALAAEQSAYQALLKATPREYRMSRSRGQSGASGQGNQDEVDQLELTGEENRYETEHQATATPTQQQREQTQTLDRLKQMARRQQDLNDRLRDLQTALQEAKTDQQREEIQRQLKRLRDEERQMLSDVDQLRQQLEQSPDAAKQAGARQQLEQTRADVQRASQELEHQSVSEALAAGSRAEQNLQNLRQNLRKQTSSQFTEQMRQLRTQARDLANRESQIAHDLDGLNNSNQKRLDDASQRKSLVDQMARQQSALTNLTSEMRAVTERAESTEPLLSKQLYDILRRADQAHTDDQLEVGGRLVDRGFLPQASQAERAARESIDELRQNVDRAADSVLGSEADALRYAKKQLEDLSGQMNKELSSQTNSIRSGAEQSSQDQGKKSSPAPSNSASGTSEKEQLRQFAQQLGKSVSASEQSGPITGSNYADWVDHLRDVEQAVDSPDVRNQLATVRERVGVYRRAFRENRRLPSHEELQTKVLAPLALAHDWVGQELSRAQDDRSLVPLDRDPVQDKYSDLVRKYYEKLGSSQ